MISSFSKNIRLFFLIEKEVPGSMEVGGYVMLAIIVVLALGCINSSIKARKEKQAGHQEESSTK